MGLYSEETVLHEDICDGRVLITSVWDAENSEDVRESNFLIVNLTLAFLDEK